MSVRGLNVECLDGVKGPGGEATGSGEVDSSESSSVSFSSPLSSHSKDSMRSTCGGVAWFLQEESSLDL